MYISGEGQFSIGLSLLLKPEEEFEELEGLLFLPPKPKRI